MKLKFDDLNDLLEHIKRLSADKHHTRGQWTIAQIFFHLAAAFEGSVNGLPAGYSMPARVIARRFRWLITRYRFPPWMPIPSSIKEALEPPATADFCHEKQRLVLAIESFQNYTDDHPPHPVLGRLTHIEWIGFHLRHCEHHLLFVCQDST